MSVLSCPHHRRSAERGFTLIEMLTVVSIIGILSMIAYPAYRDHVIRSKVPEAVAGLGQRAIEAERYFQDNRTYVGLTACTSASGKNFDFSCDGAATAAAFTLQAVGKGQMAGLTYKVDQTGARTTTVAAGAPSGWTAPSPNNCWAVKKGGEC